MNRIYLIIPILLGFVLIFPSGNYLSAQATNPFELFSKKDSILIETINQEVNIQDSITEDSVISNSSTPDSESITPVTNPANPISESSLESVVQDEITRNPFELRSDNSENITESAASLDQAEQPNIEIVTTDIGDTTINDQSITNPLQEEFIEKPSPPKKGKNLIVFWISMICGLLLSVAINSNRSILNKIGKSLRNLSYMKLLQKEERSGLSGGFIILHIIYVLNAAIFIKFACVYFEIPFLSYSFLKILFAVLLLVLFRHFSLIVIAYLRKRLPDAINYSFIITTINLLMGLILIPINLLIAFGPEYIANKTIIFGLIIFALSFLLRWFRGFLNSLRIIVGDSFHFLLYLCTCEIVPVMIIMGYVRSLIN